MINDQYFNLEASLMSDDRIRRLTERYGLRGFGVYIALLLELRQHEKYTCNPVVLRDLYRRYDTSLEVIESIVHDFGLFNVKGEGETACISSPYLNRVMKPLDDKRKKQSQTGKRTSSLAKRSANGQFTSIAGTVEKSRVRPVFPVARQQPANKPQAR